MKNKLILFAMFLGFQSCQNNSSEPQKGRCADSTAADSSYSRFIPVDSANIMISSYLHSINYFTNDTALQSLVIDAGQLKRYINEAPDKIVQFKLILAHKLDYINAGNSGKFAGYNRNALTLVIAGCNANGDYVYLDKNSVLDFATPCPPDCPPGEAASPLLLEQITNGAVLPEK